MKKYAFILLVLVLIGAALTVRFFSQSQSLDQSAFFNTSESIRNLQALDADLALLLNESRYKQNFDHAQLRDINYEISEAFDSLRYETLPDQINNSESLKKAVANFETQFILREEVLDEYLHSNGAIRKSLTTIDEKTKELSSLQNKQQDLIELLTEVNGEVYRLALGADSVKDLAINDKLQRILQNAEEDTAENLAAYVAAFKKIGQNHGLSREQFDRLNALRTSPTLDLIKDEYTVYSTKAASGSSKFRNALIIYGLCLLGALLFFAAKVRKNYLSLEQEVTDQKADAEAAFDNFQEPQKPVIQDDETDSLGQLVADVTDEINTPLGHVSSNINTMALNLNELTSVIKEFDSVVSATQSPKRDGKEISLRLIDTINTYNKIDVPNLMGKTQQLLADNSNGLGEISKLMESLKGVTQEDQPKTEKTDIHHCIEDSLTVASKHIRENNVTVDTQFSDVPKLSCFPAKIKQLLFNIIANGCQAMSKSGGQLFVSTKQVDNQIEISVIDQGTGMDESTLKKIFDPLFTSKKVPAGHESGLSMSCKIVEAHNGTLGVRSAVGKGTSIIVSLPVTHLPTLR